jgi:hypothetical protein
MSTVPEQFLFEVRCAGCSRLIGVSVARKYGLFCDPFDAWDFGCSATEQRDAIIEALWRDTDRPQADIARDFNVTRQRLYQLREARDVRKIALK